MARWQPDAAGRLQAAALDLYADNGYDETTVAQIAARAGLTERTYFRHFADKREVLFHGSEQMRDRIVTSVDEAPAGIEPLEVVALAVESIGTFFDEHREHSTRRYRVVAASPELQERELIKRASLVHAVGDALRRRGVTDPLAELTAEMGMTVFSLAYQRWAVDPQERPYATHVRELLAQLGGVTAARPPTGAGVGVGTGTGATREPVPVGPA
jgi:AcrR family transcriptional regulator